MECQYRLYYGVRACVCAEGNIAVPLRKMCDTIPLYIITKHHFAHEISPVAANLLLYRSKRCLVYVVYRRRLHLTSTLATRLYVI